jgi:hypothetical protein
MKVISDRAVALSSPDFPDSFVMVNDDGSVEIRAGEASILLIPEGEIIIQCSRLRFINDVMEWNGVEFNSRAVNPSEPALTVSTKTLLPSSRSVKDYGN